MIRRQLRVVHRWIGLCLLAPLFVQGVTGAILTLEPLLRPMVAVAATPGEPASINAIVAAARSVVPADLRPARYVPPPRQGQAAEVWFGPQASGAPRGTHIVRIDPVTLSPLGPMEPSGGAIDWLRRVHTNFLLQDYGGRAIVGWVGVGMVILSLLGIPLWWPRPGAWRKGLTVSARARGVVFQRRLHGAAGIWALVMMLATGTTGAVLGFPQAIRSVIGLPPGGPPRTVPAGQAATRFMPNLDAAVALARGATSGRALRTMVIPASAGEPVRMFLGPPDTEGAVTATVVATDATGARVLSRQDPQDLSQGEKALRWVHDLHEGMGLGPLWRGATVLVGLVVPVMAISGGTMWLLRRRNRKRVQFTDPASLQTRP